MSRYYERTTREKIGEVSVDSGQLIVIDPCYLKTWKDGEFDENTPADNDYAEACFATIGDKGHGPIFKELAVAFASGYGDGTYNVYAEKNQQGTIVRVVIELDDEEEEDED